MTEQMWSPRLLKRLPDKAVAAAIIVGLVALGLMLRGASLVEVLVGVLLISAVLLIEQ
jgi:hypothetical protein